MNYLAYSHEDVSVTVGNPCLNAGAPPAQLPGAAPSARSDDGGKRMSWTKPRVTEVCLALEINCYASATV